MGWVMRAHVFRAIAFEGDVRVEDPDGIVVEAEFVPARRAASSSSPRARGGSTSRSPSGSRSGGAPPTARGYRYEVRGVVRGELEVERKP